MMSVQDALPMVPLPAVYSRGLIISHPPPPLLVIRDVPDCFSKLLLLAFIPAGSLEPSSEIKLSD